MHTEILSEERQSVSTRRHQVGKRMHWLKDFCQKILETNPTSRRRGFLSDWNWHGNFLLRDGFLRHSWHFKNMVHFQNFNVMSLKLNTKHGYTLTMHTYHRTNKIILCLGT